MAETLLDFEVDVLRVANGEEVKGFAWGAAVSEALGALKARGLVTPPPNYRATQAGKDYLASLS